MTRTPKARDPLDVLRQLGLVARESCMAAPAFRDDFFEIRDAGTGGAPTAASTRFDVRFSNLELRSVPIGDAVAAFIGNANHLIVGDGDWPPDELAFSNGHIAYFCAHCADGDYGEWRGDVDPERDVLVLRDPREIYGTMYEEWIASVLDLADRGRLGPLIETAYAPYRDAAGAPGPG